MLYSIKIQHRSAGPKPWKREIFADGRLVTASHKSFDSQFAAHRHGRVPLVRLQSKASTAIEPIPQSAVYASVDLESVVCTTDKEELYRRLAQARRMSAGANDAMTTKRLQTLISDLEEQLAGAEVQDTDAPPTGAS